MKELVAENDGAEGDRAKMREGEVDCKAEVERYIGGGKAVEVGDAEREDVGELKEERAEEVANPHDEGKGEEEGEDAEEAE